MARVNLSSILVLFIVSIYCFTQWNPAVEATTELEQLVEGYDAINDYLVDKNIQGSMESNVDSVINWMNSNKLKFTKMFKDTKSLDAALKEFTALRNTAHEAHKCNSETYAILFKNDQATELRTHVPDSKLSQRTLRIDKIVHYYALKHAKECQSVYPQSFEKVHQQMDQEKVQRVERYMEELIGAHLFLVDPSLPSFKAYESFFFTPDQRSFFIDNIMSINSVTGFGDAEVAMSAIVSQDKNLANLMSRRPDKVVSLVRTHLVEPCQYYMEKLGPDVFIPAEYDSQILEEDERYQPFNMETSKFYLALTYFRICKVLVSSQRDIVQQLMGLAQQKSRMG